MTPINMPDVDKVHATFAGALDAKGAVVDLVSGSTFLWEAVQTDGTGTFGAITPDNPDPALATGAEFVAGIPPAKGYIKLTVADEGVGFLVGQSDEIDLMVGVPTHCAITLGPLEAA